MVDLDFMVDEGNGTTSGRSSSERRHKDFHKAIRKRNISKVIYGNRFDYYNNLHQYSKNKIHCSCYWCSKKKTGNSIMDLSIRDRRNKQMMDDSLKDFECA